MSSPCGAGTEADSSVELKAAPALGREGLRLRLWLVLSLRLQLPPFCQTRCWLSSGS